MNIHEENISAVKDVSLLWCIAALLGYAGVLFAPQLFNDGDTYLHVAVGQWIIEHHALPYQEPFSYPVLGVQWVAHEWLAEVGMALAYQLAGWNGIVIVYGAAFALLLWLLANHLSRVLNFSQTVVTLILVTDCIVAHLLLRPHVLTLPIMELWTAVLIFARAEKRIPSLWWVLLITLWANLHGGFIFGLALIAPFALEAILENKDQLHKTLRDWGMFFAGALVASCINPYGWHALLAPLLTMRMTQLSALNEWKSIDFGTFQPMEVPLMAVLYTCLTYGVRIPAVRAVMLLLLLHQSFQHVRFEMQLGIVGALLLAEPLAKGFGTCPPTGITHKLKLSNIGILYLFMGAIALTIMRFSQPLPLLRPDSIVSPVSALKHVPEALRDKPVLNENAFGAYMIFEHFHPFIDSRIDIYGDTFFKNYLDMMKPDRPRLEQIIKDYNVQWVIFEVETPIVSVMDTLPGWHRLYTDKIAVIYVRDVAQKEHKK